MFEKEYRMLSFVPRWAIAPRHHQQMVDSHSYYVILYASQICDLIGVLPETKVDVLDWAIRHDAFESWTSDLPGPAKRAIIDATAYEEYHKQFSRINPDYAAYSDPSKIAKIIVKVCDLIDGWFFLATEVAMGNQMVAGLQEREWERMGMALDHLEEIRPGTKKTIQNELLAQRRRLVNAGAYIPLKDEDLIRKAKEEEFNRLAAADEGGE